MERPGTDSKSRFLKKRAQGNFKDVISMCPSKINVKSKNSEQVNHIYLNLI